MSSADLKMALGQEQRKKSSSGGEKKVLGRPKRLQDRKALGSVRDELKRLLPVSRIKRLIYRAGPTHHAMSNLVPVVRALVGVLTREMLMGSFTMAEHCRRKTVTPDDVKEAAAACLKHRLYTYRQKPPVQQKPLLSEKAKPVAAEKAKPVVTEKAKPVAVPVVESVPSAKVGAVTSDESDDE